MPLIQPKHKHARLARRDLEDPWLCLFVVYGMSGSLENKFTEFLVLQTILTVTASSRQVLNCSFSEFPPALRPHLPSLAEAREVGLSGGPSNTDLAEHSMTAGLHQHAVYHVQCGSSRVQPVGSTPDHKRTLECPDHIPSRPVPKQTD